ncbi:MAG: hypothetical protein ABIF40_01970 [archaeon]
MPEDDYQQDSEKLNIIEHESDVIGQNFYVQNPEQEFTQQIQSWLKYLGIQDLFPNLNDIEQMYEVGSELRNAGNASFLGLAGQRTNSVFFRPGDYNTLLHELIHNNPEFQGTLLAKEAGAFAVEIHTCGDYNILNDLIKGQSYQTSDKRIGRFVCEAMLVTGRPIFDILKKLPANVSEDEVLVGLTKLVNEAEQQYLKSPMTATEYLTDLHNVTPYVANYLLRNTKDTKRTIFRSTTQTKKDVIGAFKALTSFYHINLGYSLTDAINQTEEHFEKDEALTLHKTLMTGAKDVFAKLKEYGYSLEICQAVSEMIISQGASKAIDYSKGMPQFLELTGEYGPRGEEILSYALDNPNFLDAMVLTDGADGLLKLSKSEPENVPHLLHELSRFNWTHELAEDILNVGPDYVYKTNRKQLAKLSIQERARIVALSMYLTSHPQRGTITTAVQYGNLPNNLREILKLSPKKQQQILAKSLPGYKDSKVTEEPKQIEEESKKGLLHWLTKKGRKK